MLYAVFLSRKATQHSLLSSQEGSDRHLNLLNSILIEIFTEEFIQLNPLTAKLYNLQITDLTTWRSTPFKSC